MHETAGYVLVTHQKQRISEKGDITKHYIDILHCPTLKWNWNTGADSIGYAGHVLPSPLLRMAGHGGTVSKTANNELTKLYWPSRKRSPKRLIVLLEPKKWRGTTKKKISRRFAPDRCSPTLKFVLAPLNETKQFQNCFVSVSFQCDDSFLLNKDFSQIPYKSGTYVSPMLRYAETWLVDRAPWRHSGTPADCASSAAEVYE